MEGVLGSSERIVGCCRQLFVYLITGNLRPMFLGCTYRDFARRPPTPAPTPWVFQEKHLVNYISCGMSIDLPKAAAKAIEPAVVEGIATTSRGALALAVTTPS